ncbi:ankyrin repeat domain-containing protein [Candidatus Cardinium hertigii]|nr:ankyrin repeat domain-containing protein [Candidatus Cardinium hertigii]
MAHCICSCANQYQMMFPFQQTYQAVQQPVAGTEVASCCYALFTAAEKGHVSCAKCLLKQNPALINEKDVEGYTVLHLAARNDRIDCLKFFLNLKPDLINEKNHHHETALHAAMRYSNFEKYQCLNEHTDRNRETTRDRMIEALAYGGLECLKILLERAPALINEKNRCDETALHLAAQFGRLKSLEILVDRAPALINERDRSDDTALCCAIRGDVIVDFQEILIKRRAEPIFPFANQFSGLNRLKCLEILVNKTPPALINKKNKYGYTALRYAVRGDSMDFVRVLLEHPQACIWINETDDQGKTALDYVISFGKKVYVELLLSKRANITPFALYFAAKGDNNNSYCYGSYEDVYKKRSGHQFDYLRILLKANPSCINVKDRMGRTALHLAAQDGHIDALWTLLRLNPKLLIINAKDHNGKTALDYAIISGEKECIELLNDAAIAERNSNADEAMDVDETISEIKPEPKSPNIVDPEARIELGDNAQEKLAALKRKRKMRKNAFEDNKLRYYYCPNDTSKGSYQKLKKESAWLDEKFDDFYNEFFSKEKTYKDDLVEIQKIDREDSRVSLRNQDKLVATKSIPAYTVLGIYVGKYLFTDDETNSITLSKDIEKEMDYMRERGVSFKKCSNLSGKLNNYGFNVPMPGTSSMMVSGYGRGNPLIKINAYYDYRGDPQLEEELKKKINVESHCVRSNQIHDGYLPFVLLYTNKDIQAGDEFLLDYGKDYWTTKECLDLTNLEEEEEGIF